MPDPAGATTLEEWDEPGERARVRGDHLVLWLDTPAHSAKLTNTLIEKRTGRVATTLDIKVVRALAEKWGA